MLAITLLSVGFCGLYWFTAQEKAPSPFAGDLSEPGEVDASVQRDPDNSGDRRLQRLLSGAHSEEEKVAVLQELALDPDARSSMPELRSMMVTERSRLVREKAFETCKLLAEREGREAVTSLLLDTVRNPYPELRREGLRACVQHPRYELMADLIEVADAGGQERFLAVQALAFIDDEVAQQKVLEMARSEEIPRAERLRAVVLLSQTNLAEGTYYLQDLAAGNDPELSKHAAAALEAMQEKRKRTK